MCIVKHLLRRQKPNSLSHLPFWMMMMMVEVVVVAEEEEEVQLVGMKYDCHWQPRWSAVALLY